MILVPLWFQVRNFILNIQMSLHLILGMRWGLMFKLHFMGRRRELDKIIHILLGTVITGKEGNKKKTVMHRALWFSY